MLKTVPKGFLEGILKKKLIAFDEGSYILIDKSTSNSFVCSTKSGPICIEGRDLEKRARAWAVKSGFILPAANGDTEKVLIECTRVFQKLKKKQSEKTARANSHS